MREPLVITSQLENKFLHPYFSKYAPAEEVTDDTAQSAPSTTNLLRAFLADPFVGSVLPSSQKLCKAVAACLNIENGADIIELGAGTGTLTQHLLQKLGTESKLYAFERNRKLAATLAYRIQDPRLISLHASAEKLMHFRKDLHERNIAAIVSGIPFRFFEPPVVHSIIRQCADALMSEGSLILYQTWMPFGQIYKPLERALNKFFTIQGSQVVFYNLPPLYIMHCTRR